MTTSICARMRALGIALCSAVAIVSGAGLSALAGETGTEPSDVVLVFDVSNSILRSTDGTNREFADALEGIADRVDVVADDLAAGNAKVSFVVFGRTAVPYPANCARLNLHENPVAIARFEACLRSIASEYRAGPQAKVRGRLNTQDTDHVAALVEASKLLPDTSTRSAVIFFTDGEHDPPGTGRDNENVVAKVRPSFAGRTPLAVLPVGLGSRAGKFESELTSIYDAFFRDMQPCAGRASFAWPEVAFPSADAAGTAVALALQEVTCSFTVAPTPTPAPTPTAVPPTAAPPTPDPTPAVVLTAPGAMSQPRVELLDGAARLSADPPSGGSPAEQYVYECTTAAGAVVRGTGPTPAVVVAGLANGETFQCVAYAENRAGRSAASPASASFSPCGGLLGCNPWIGFVLAGIVLAMLALAAVLYSRRYQRRNRVWVTAQVDGGENRPLGWGPEIGIRLVDEAAGWFATALPPEATAPVHVRYRGENRFVVTEGKRVADVHQGDPTNVRDEAGALHQLILRRYGDKPKETKARSGRDAAGSPALGARLPGREASAAPAGPADDAPAAPDTR